MPRLINVCPRYTCGSPAGVDPDTAASVVIQERQAYEAAREGFHGKEIQATAERLGLQRVVYQLFEKRGKWNKLEDLITGEVIEGNKAVEIELAALGVRAIPKKQEKMLNAWGIQNQFNAMDFVDRREILTNCLRDGWMLDNQERFHNK